MEPRTLTANEVKKVVRVCGSGFFNVEKTSSLAEKLEISPRALATYQKEGTRKGAANVLLRELAIKHGILSSEGNPHEI